MNTEEKEAVLIALMTGLREQESWCGETHVQKAAYILQEGLKVPIGLDFVLYKHGRTRSTFTICLARCEQTCS